MKLKKVAALCNSVSIYRLYDELDGNTGAVRQWLGDAGAIYPLDGLPLLSEQELYRMFDVPEKKQGKSYFGKEVLPEGLDVNDWCAGEQLAEDMDVTITYNGTALLPLRYAGGILYIQSKYMSPLEDQADFLQLFVRRMPNGTPYVAAKAGMLITGVIFPYLHTNGALCDCLSEIAEKTRWSVGWRQAKRESENADAEQTALFGNRDGAGDAET